MVDDEQLAEHVEQFERAERRAAAELAGRVEKLEQSAAGVHDELARRIEETRDDAADESTVTALASRLDDIEERLTEIEDEL